MKVLVTGGAGYIGSAVCTTLEDHGHTPIILDSLVNGRIEYTKGRVFYHGDIANEVLLQKIVTEHPDLFATIHCAALIVVPESVNHPFEYYHENVSKSLLLFKTLERLKKPRIVFSSSAAIYAPVEGFMVDENSPLAPGNPYARSKWMMENILQDFCQAYSMQGISLRYFNPIGADKKMRCGPYVKSATHLLGSLLDVEAKRRPTFQITGTQWPTRDGTGIRDYIHINDLANAHVSAVEKFDSVFKNSNTNIKNYCVINLGTGRGVTVREFIGAFESIIGHTIPKVDAESRPGDVAGAYANANRARELLGWQANEAIEQGIRDALQWNTVRESKLGELK